MPIITKTSPNDNNDRIPNLQQFYWYRVSIHQVVINRFSLIHGKIEISFKKKSMN